MKKYLLVMLTLATSCKGIYHQRRASEMSQGGASSAPDKMVWNAIAPLQYSDFKGAVPPVTPWDAVTNSCIWLEYSYDDESVISYTLQCVFDESNSWMRLRSPEVLRHEQVHFNITEIYTRRLRHAIRQVTDWKGHPAENLNALFHQFNQKCAAMQDLYDAQTNHGMIAPMQQAWQRQTDSLLLATNILH